MEFSWINSIIEVSATFVAITAGFLSSKIISIASEKGQVKIDIDLLDTNIAEKEDNIEALEKRIGTIGFKWAEEGFDLLRDDVKTLLKGIDEKPPVDVVIAVLSKKENIDDYDEILLKERYDSLWNEVEVEKEAERKAKEAQRKRQEQLARNPRMKGLFDSFDFSSLGEISRAASALSAYSFVNLVDKDIRISEREEFRSLSKERDEEILLKKTYEAQREILLNKVSKIYLPKYLWLGLLSLLFFALVGIILPILIVSNIENFIVDGVLINQSSLILFFISGLLLNLGYLWIEVNELIKR